MNKPVERIPGYANYQDSLVVENLCDAPLSTLPIDEFAPVLFKEVGHSKEDSLLALRFAVIRVYLCAASIRLNAKAAGKQITSATKAAYLMMEAIDHLGRVEPFPSWGLNAALAVPYPDPKGLSEPSTFTYACWEAKLNIVSTVMRLIEAIDQEKHKPRSKGERKKRLRISVEALSDWWESTGRSIAPYVKAKRRDNAPAVVIGRFGDFVSLAIAVFCKLDSFSEAEVTAAITNVHKARLAKSKDAGICTK